MTDLSYETANEVWDAILDDVYGDSVGSFLDWHSIDSDDLDKTVEFISDAIESLREA